MSKKIILRFFLMSFFLWGFNPIIVTANLDKGKNTEAAQISIGKSHYVHNRGSIQAHSVVNKAQDIGFNENSTSTVPITWVRDAIARKAVCNDGSPSGYYFAPTTSGSTVWIIHLQGGGFCYDNESCVSRKNNPTKDTSVSSLHWETNPPEGEGNGILSPNLPENPYFFDANHVYMRYCSSDFFSGNRDLQIFDPIHGLIPWYFHGRDIIRTTFEDLGSPIDPELPSLQDASKVLLSGGSAGGVSIFPVLDWAAGQLESMYGISYVRGLSDAGWLVDISPYLPYIQPISVQLQSAYSYWYAQGNLDSDCEAANTGNEWRCFVGKFAYNNIGTPIFIYNSQYDRDALLVLGAIQPYDESEMRYREQYRSEIVVSLRPESIMNAFVPISEEHAIAVHPESQRVIINGLSLQDLVGPWFFDAAGIRKLIQDRFVTYLPILIN